MKTTAEMIAVMQAAAEGKVIELWDRVEWIPCPVPRWDWGTCNYRVKPAPRHIYAEAGIDSGEFTKNVFFPSPNYPMPSTKPGYVWVKLSEVIK